MMPVHWSLKNVFSHEVKGGSKVNRIFGKFGNLVKMGFAVPWFEEGVIGCPVGQNFRFWFLEGTRKCTTILGLFIR
eukprot:1711826-Rhodomonas_salina.1